MTSSVKDMVDVAAAEKLAAAVVGRVSNIASLPEATQQIIAMVEDRSASAQQLQRIVSHDPSLVTRILKVVNSAFYGLPGQVNSVDRAIVLLGLMAVKNIAVASSIGQLFRGTKVGEKHTAKDLWMHCVAVAVASKELARQTHSVPPDEAFLAGMVHDVGLLVSLQTNPAALTQACAGAEAGERFIEAEQAQTQFDHAMLGYFLSRKWNFPEACQQAARWHHDPASAAEQHRPIVGIIMVADTLCGEAGIGFPLTTAGQTLDEGFLAELKISPTAVAELREHLPELVDKASAMVAG